MQSNSISISNAFHTKFNIMNNIFLDLLPLGFDKISQLYTREDESATTFTRSIILSWRNKLD